MSDYRVRSERLARTLAPLTRLAAAIAPEVTVRQEATDGRLAGQYRPSMDGHPPTIAIYQLRDDGDGCDVRLEPYESDAVLLHELGHYLLDAIDHTQADADALGAALAEHYEAELNVPLADVLERLGRHHHRRSTD